MKWIEIKIKTTEEACDAISYMLTSIGAGGVAIEDPNEIRRETQKSNSIDYVDDEFLNSLGEDVVVKAYFPGETNVPELVSLIKEKLAFIGTFLNVGEGYCGYAEMDEEDWSNSWKKYYKPLHLTDRLIVKPSWENYDNKDGEIIIEMNPGMAFGTGTHETTKMCAVLLDKYVKDGCRVIDVGCGTGILSIIASKLGAAEVTAVDIDEVAVKVAKENLELNKVDNVRVFKGVLDDIEKEKRDIVVANIIANVIMDISSRVPYYLKKDGLFIASGIIKERKQEVLDECLRKGFECVEIIEMGEWVAIVLRCLDSL
ncbi:MAG TPA: 50S ribosomal protein L11 methyltransferase [Hungateiclostridium thermocellum]|uniref:Ribosomal protein L11 methyltransferase n=2 Tax=Acetivibrio thermocellus TaxID=1515 RepID=PRMA_ACET2|nr:50S ribosomal protein L11 methyltransferase [Acetivibrio thermocellus]A3DF23.1 RecName: Full=Ribosomal protein L11 methyltransferase; Short=L11 Mtase [Acetivibrio thermocellus ATCC 27405]CDG35993.1 Ribosomal protein L11 methyltransferase [Acetivibrio thermocellus BC1]ABN52552.1 ribosomal protein L11 methyltransferase [Acetivibrio thermocellus ATCC 27405]ADU74003.1 ribosomal protein L11 methyltransferase [Acetivibrio thermocellus DSM 1313]ALX07941.1 Ribosomal protein L11 methyltransferase [A